MYFKKLEIFGFKSFADKITVNFEPGITCIVGPNGCGKTNVVDAIRWVLGEQSAKQLRAGKMEDIIFNGSRTRKPLGLAEVSLSLDNSQNILPIEYREVTVTRRLFRSGESEYYINKTACRLKDITALFLDTGMGTDTYSLMEEKKINFILNSKPEERRTIFEEVAGVMKYKWRREEALRKLESTQANLTRLSDIIAEVKRQINSLDYQARKARQYQKYREQLKLLEIRRLMKNYARIKEESSQGEEKISSLYSEAERLNNECKQKEDSTLQLRRQLREKEEELTRTQRELFSLSSEISRFQDRLLLGKERKEEIEGERAQLRGQIEDGTSKISLLDEKISQTEKEHEKLAKQLEETNSAFSSKEEILRSLTERLVHLSTSLEERKEAVVELMNRTAQTRNRLISLELDRKSLLSRKEKLNAEEKRRREDKEILQGEISGKQEQVNKENEKLAEIDERNNLLVKERDSVLESLKQAINKADEIQQKYSLRLGLIQSSSELSGKETLVEEVLARGFPGVYGTVARLVSFPREYEVILEKLLGERLQYLVCEDTESALAVIEYLKREKKGYLTFLPIKELPVSNPGPVIPQDVVGIPLLEKLGYEKKYQKVMEFLLGNIFLVESLDQIDPAETRNRQEEKSKKEIIFLTKEGDILTSSGILSGGSREFLEENISIRNKKIKDLEREISQLKKELDKIIEQRAKLEEKISDVNRQIEKNKELSRNTQISIAQLAEIISQKEELKKRLDSEINLLIDEQSIIDKDISTGAGDVEQLTNDQKAGETSHEEIQEMIDGLEKDHHSVAEQEKEEREKVVGLKILKTQLEEKERNLQSERSHLESEREGLLNLIDQRKEALANLEGKVTGIEEIKISGEKEISSLSESKNRLEIELKRLQEEKEKINQSLQEEESILGQKKGELSRIESDLTQEKIDSNRFSLELGQIKERLTEEYSLSLEEALNTVSQAPVDTSEDYGREIEKLKHRIETMGLVNLAAPEEYETLNERYKFLKSQEEDLIKSSEDLRKVISKIDGTTRANFKKTFTSVRNNFQKVFTQLFEGGEADLVLTNEEDLLETGVDIVAQPPGKKLQNISLLSGGEKALCAIALLFALFMVKPSPFCVLDEVDAPLDDANLQRFTMLLKEFVNKAQFIVVTHNKKTMEMSDVLYGITMEEFGISKLISVKFQKPSPA
ncbi:chromosome segregation protein SMC [bacterium]|nr:chromosome segregation protein SMC [bacterium]NIN92155.1 chromosome segregation protein SMC [bacterium]NIO18813.1 chromosome segregation protein SMC [bacterium]NIO73897.1 chromosome segregation protein SMC [bacterium]